MKAKPTLTGFLAKSPPIGKGKKYLVLLNGQPFAGFDTREEANEACGMYGREIRLRKGLAYCSQQKWTVRF